MRARHRRRTQRVLGAAALLIAAGCSCDPPIAEPWAEPGFWTASSDLDRIFDLEQAPANAHYQLVMCRSSSGYGQDMRCETIGHTVSTLDLFVLDEGIILLGGLALEDWGLIEQGGNHLYAFTSQDLEHWGTHLWPVKRTASPCLTDASLERLPDGSVRAVYVSHCVGEAEENHEVRTARPHGDHWREARKPIFEGPGLLDPATCQHEGIQHLFATGKGLVHATGVSPDRYTADQAFYWPDTQVPFCFQHKDQLWVIAQHGGGWGPPELRKLKPDGSFGPAFPLWKEGAYPELPSCTSPVGGRYRDEYLLFCAVHR